MVPLLRVSTLNKNYCPNARTDKILTTKVGKEWVVFNTATNTASCLDALTAAVWAACDGKTKVSGLPGLMDRSGYTNVNEHVIWLAIDQLSKTGLLEESIDIPLLDKNGLHRRKALSMFRTGALAALPVVASISIQPAMAQMSHGCRPEKASCTANSDCCYGDCEEGRCDD